MGENIEEPLTKEIIKTKIKFSDYSKRMEEKNARLLRNGHKEFTIDGITVIALNESAAIKKVEKIKKSNK